MTSKKLGGVGKRRSNKWTHDQRIFLHLLRDSFNLSWKDGTKIFNEYLLDLGIPDGLLSPTLSSQYAERKKGNPAWAGICQPPFTTEETAKRDLISQKIIQIAGSLGIRLSLQSSSSANTQTRPRPATKRKRSVIGAAYADAEDDEHLSNQVRKQTRVFRQNPVVVIPESQSQIARITVAARCLQTPPKTPRKLSARRLNAKIPYFLPTGNSILLTPKELAETQQEFQAPLQGLVHPQLPGLLFR